VQKAIDKAPRRVVRRGLARRTADQQLALAQQHVLIDSLNPAARPIRNCAAVWKPVGQDPPIPSPAEWRKKLERRSALGRLDYVLVNDDPDSDKAKAEVDHHITAANLRLRSKPKLVIMCGAIATQIRGHEITLLRTGRHHPAGTRRYMGSPGCDVIGNVTLEAGPLSGFGCTPARRSRA